ncbi:MAG: tetratricopeptide repeat protein, partial [Vicinamibacterales bacterium]
MRARWLLLLLLAAGACASQEERASSAHDLAVRDLERGDLHAAEQIARQYDARWRNQPRSPWHWRFLLLSAEVLIAQGKAAEALALVHAPVVSDAEAEPLEARRLKVRAHAALNLGRYEEATRLLEEASRQATAAALPRLALEIHVLRGLLLIRTNHEAAGEAVTRVAYSRAVAQHDPYWQAAAANNLGLERMRAYRYDEAIPLLEQALKAAKSIEAQRFAAASLANLGTCYYRIGDSDKALAFLQQAAEIQERIGATVGLQSSLGDIGNVHVMQGHADRAVPFYQRALAMARASAPWD